MGYEIRTFPLVFDKEIHPVPKENHADEEIDNRRDFRQKRMKVNDELQRQPTSTYTDKMKMKI